MDTHDAFLQAIREEPDDDFHRLIYTDWLEDHGEEERAWQIRFGIEAVHLRCRASFAHNRKTCSKCTGYDRVWSHARTLLGETFAGCEIVRMTGEAQARIDDDLLVTLSRGFIASVRCSESAWREFGCALACNHPLAHVRLDDKAAERLETSCYWDVWHADAADGNKRAIPADLVGLTTACTLFFTTVAEADAWLSDSLIAQARSAPMMNAGVAAP